VVTQVLFFGSLIGDLSWAATRGRPSRVSRIQIVVLASFAAWIAIAGILAKVF
jgi:hypothetical protein